MISFAELSDKGRAVAYSPNGEQLAVGLYNGKVQVFTHDLSSLVCEPQIAGDWISDMKWVEGGGFEGVAMHKVWTLVT